MMKLKVRRKKFGIGSLIFMLLFGAVFTGAGFFALNSSRIDPDWTTVSGEVVDSSSRTRDGSTVYSPIVAYEVDGQTHRVTSNISSAGSPKIGASREVAYNPANPGQAKLVESARTQWFLYAFPLIGIALLAGSPFLFIRSWRRSNAIKKLLQDGQKIQGVVVDVQSQGSSNRSKYKIVVSAADTSGNVKNYVSDSLTGIGGLAMMDFRQNPIPMDVYIDPADPKIYYVDISDVPNLTPERIGELIKSATTNRPGNTSTEEEAPSSRRPPGNITLPPTA